MKRVAEVIFLLLVVALAMRAWTSAAAVSQELRVNGLTASDTMASSYARLGEPVCQGSLPVGNNKEMGRYAEWGTAKQLTWNGSPTLTFWPDGRLLATIGTFLTRGDKVVHLGDSRATVESAIGDPTERDSHSATYRLPACSLYLSYDGRGYLTRIVRANDSPAVP